MDLSPPSASLGNRIAHGVTHRRSGKRRLPFARPWLSAAVVIVLVGGGVLAYRQFGPTTSTSATAAVTTRLVSVSTGTIRESVSASGTIAPALDDDVSFASSATITSVRVSVGQHVKKGQILGTVDPLSLRSTLAQARATLASAKSSLATAEDDDSTTSAQLTVDKLAVTSAKKSVASAKTALAEHVLRSPITGTVAAVNVAKGDTSSGSGSLGSSSGSSSGSSGSSSSSGATTTDSSSSSSSTSSSSSGDFEIIGTSSWTVSASVDDTEVGLIRKGDEVQLTSDNVSSTIFGVVTSVAVLSSDSSGSASYPVTISITGSPSGLHDGASATASIIYKQVTNVLTVTTTAIHRDSSGSYVYVSKNGTKTKVVVHTGISSGVTTQITSGLTSGQQVYVQTVTRTRTSGSTSTSSNTDTNSGYTGGGPGGTGNFGGGTGGGNFGGGTGGSR